MEIISVQVYTCRTTSPPWSLICPPSFWSIDTPSEYDSESISFGIPFLIGAAVFECWQYWRTEAWFLATVLYMSLSLSRDRYHAVTLHIDGFIFRNPGSNTPCFPHGCRPHKEPPSAWRREHLRARGNWCSPSTQKYKATDISPSTQKDV